MSVNEMTGLFVAAGVLLAAGMFMRWKLHSREIRTIGIGTLMLSATLCAIAMYNFFLPFFK